MAVSTLTDQISLHVNLQISCFMHGQTPFLSVCFSLSSSNSLIHNTHLCDVCVSFCLLRTFLSIMYHPALTLTLTLTRTLTDVRGEDDHDPMCLGRRRNILNKF